MSKKPLFRPKIAREWAESPLTCAIAFGIPKYPILDPKNITIGQQTKKIWLIHYFRHSDWIWKWLVCITYKYVSSVLVQNHSNACETCIIHKILWEFHFWHRKVSSSNRRRAISLFWSLIHANFKNLWIGWTKKVVIPLFCTFSICLGSGHSKNAHLKNLVIISFDPESKISCTV